MPEARPPDGFAWTWAGDTVRVDLPHFVRSGDQSYEPVLTRGDIEKLAEALTLYERRRREMNRTAQPLARVLLAHSPRFSSETLANFRAKLAMALIERGRKPSIDEMETMSGEDPEDPTRT